MSELVAQGVQTGYSQVVEAQADYNGVQYVYATKKYNPLGLYSVILGFRQIEKSQGNLDMGNEDHPVPEMRARAIRQELADLHVPINVWEVVNFRATVMPATTVAAGYTLKLGNVELFTFSAAAGAITAQQRAQSAAAAINARLTKPDMRIQRIDVGTLVDNTAQTAQTAQVLLRLSPMITFTPNDVKSAGVSSLEELATLVKRRIQMSIFEESVKRGLTTED
jgi:hypothetical protein